MKKSIFFKSALVITALSLVFALSGCTLGDKLSGNETSVFSTQESSADNTKESTTAAATTLPPITQVVTTTKATSENLSDTPEKVWARSDVNIREKPTTESKRLGVLHEGNGIIRTEKSSDGWSKVIYDGETAYINSSYLTENEPARAASSGRVTVDPYVDTEDWQLIIVNTEREIPADYVPKLAEVASSGVYLDYRAAAHYNDMYSAAKKDGIILTPYSGYRSYARQQRNYNNLTETYMSRYGLSREDAAAKAATVILPPGTSEHNLGLAMDICNTNSTFSSQKEYKWLTEHAHEYGFILRYTAEKQPVTGIIPEPWHWRYVGIEHAAKIKESGLCLEEYVQQSEQL